MFSSVWHLALFMTLAIQQSSAQGQLNTRPYMSVANKSFKGNLIEKYGNRSVDECKERCDQTLKCTLFNYNLASRTCDLLTESSESVPEPGTTSYILDLLELIPERGNQQYTCYEDIYMYGFDINSYADYTEESCKIQCNRFPSCSMYQYESPVAGKANCRLRSLALTGFSQSETVQPKACFNDRVLPQQRHYTLERNIAYVNHELFKFEGPITDCPLACDRTPGCVGFDFDYSGTATFCTLRSNVDNKIAKDTSNGYKLTAQKIQYKSSNEARDFIAIPGKTMWFPMRISTGSVTTEQRCRDSCEEKFGCMVFRFNGTTCDTAPFALKYYDSPGNTTYITLDQEEPRIFDRRVPSTQRLYKNNKLRSPNQLHYLHVHFDGKVDISTYSVSVRSFPKSVVQIMAESSNGTLRLFNADRTVYYYGSGLNDCSNCEYDITLEDDMILRVVRSNDKVVGFSSHLDYTYPTVPVLPHKPNWAALNPADYEYWAFKTIVGSDISTNANIPDTRWGSNTRIYYIDSGVTADQDSANSFTSNTVDNYIEGPSISSVSSMSGDLYRHGTSMIVISKSKLAGLAQGATAVSVKITDWETRFFTERSFVEAVAKIDEDQVPLTVSKIISFSGAFRDGYTNVSSCAVQWAFYRNIAFIAAAGNDNRTVNSLSPNKYLLLVGSFEKPDNNGKSNIWSHSNFGIEIDIWAPNTFISTEKVGTSVATSYVSSVAAMAISIHPGQLSNNPHRLYTYLKSRAQTNSLTASEKTRVTGHTRTLYSKDLKQNIPSTAVWDTNGVIDFCKNLGFDTKVPNWNGLIATASLTRLGRIVHESSTRCKSSGTTRNNC
jgi:hypothetical protein